MFDEKTGSTTDLYEYILSKNPSKPWAATPEPKVPEATKEGTKTEDEARRTVICSFTAAFQPCACEAWLSIIHLH